MAGLSCFLSLGYQDILSLEAEWTGAASSFREDRDLKPQTWNFELAWWPQAEMELALRCAGSRDSLNFLPEKQYGAIIAYEIYDNTSIGLEYLYEEYDNHEKANRLTTQLGLEF